MDENFSEEEVQIRKFLTQEEEKASQALAKKLNLPYLNLIFAPVQKEALVLLLKERAERAEMAIFQRKGVVLKIALRNPKNPHFKEIEKELKDKKFTIEFYIVSLKSLKEAWKRYPRTKIISEPTTGRVKIGLEILKEFEKQLKNPQDLKEEIKKRKSQKTSEILEILIAGALKFDASDIHFEPQKDSSKIRYRIDGVLQDIISYSPNIHDSLLSRIKLLSGLKLNVHDTAQDGRFTITFSDRKIEIRTSILPSEWKESIVLRILDPLNLFDMKELGLREDLLEKILEELKKPYGMILVTGPTGSGKTTTLYSFLNYVKSPSLKIITIEDPIEYILDGISQTQVDSEGGYNFSNGLKSILRQDPDMILVGEIRDEDTVATALQAALTGHMVFSTLHTNDAAGAIPRLINLRAKPEIVAPAISSVIAQRLVRRVCPKCAKPKTLTAPEANKIRKELKNIPLKIKPEIKKGMEILTFKGCSKCYYTGYRGRVGIFELFSVDPEMEKIILENPSITKVREEALKRKMTTMKQDGLLKVLKKITTLEEVERVTGV